ncbi:MAG: diguanylate cyclase [Proteobacteria bacterium]|nr:diguanylate cyclase [Pseudomonadota bacterium]
MSKSFPKTKRPGQNTAQAKSGATPQSIVVVGSSSHNADLNRCNSNTETQNRFHMRGVLGEGGMGVVKEVFDANLMRSTAVKMVKDNTPNSSVARQGLIEEAQITAQLDHPNIVPVYDLGEDHDQSLFFAMKLVRGRLLKEILEEQDFMKRTENELYEHLQIFCKVCDAVAFAHNSGVIHRDLKPHNIMVGDFGQVYVIDWGLSGLKLGMQRPVVEIDEPMVENSQLTHRLPIGTAGYMAPEQARGYIESLDERTDIFGLGGILYEILTGVPPYQVDDSQSVMAKMVKGYVEPPYEHTRAYLPPRLCKIAMKALRKAPIDRYQSVIDLKHDLELIFRNGDLYHRVLTEFQETKGRLEKTVSELRRSKEELHLANKQLKIMATTDLLTGLVNRRRGLEVLASEMSRVNRGKQSLSLVMLDLDHFKQINDTYGHGVGDVVLIEVAKRLKAACRPHDVVVRWGGEELMVICPHTDSEQVEAVAERLCRVISEQPIDIQSSQAISVTASLGTVSTDSFPGLGSDKLLDRVDDALYEAKHSGRNCVRTSSMPGVLDFERWKPGLLATASR